jgi:hypothetical protein
MMSDGRGVRAATEDIQDAGDPPTKLAPRAARSRSVGRFPRLLRTRRQALLVAAVGVSAFAAAAVVLEWGAAAGPVALKLDLTYSRTACCQSIVWFNDQTRGPAAVLQIYPGQRRTYTVPVRTPEIRRLRIDPGVVVGSTVVIHAIWLERRGHVVDRLSLEEVAHFATYRARGRHVARGIEYEALTNQPSVDQFFSLQTGIGRARMFFLVAAAKPLDSLVLVLLVGAICAAAFGIRTRRDACLVIAVAATLAATRALPPLVRIHDFSADVSRAVGAAIYFGIPKSREQVLLALTVAVSVIVPLVAIAVARRSGWLKRDAAEPDAFEEPRAISRRTLWLPCAAFATLALLFAPDLHGALVATQNQLYLPQWDATNLVFWDYLVHRGRVPSKDFFYPYGLQYFFSIDPPWGTVLQYGAYLTFWGYVVFGTFLVLARFFAGRALMVRAAVLYAVVLTAAFGGELSETSRYIGALGVLLLFASIRPSDGPFAPRRILFVFAFAQLTLFELAQTIYVLVPIGCILVLEASAAARSGPFRIRRFAVLTVATLVMPLAFAAAVLGLTGQLAGTLSFYSAVPAQIAAWGAPSGAVQWVTSPHELSAFVWWAMAVSIALGVAFLSLSAGRRRAAGVLILSVGLLTAMTMQKQVVRPGIAGFIWFPALYGTLLWCLLAGGGRARHWASLAAVGGVAAAVILVSGGYRKGLVSLFHGPARIVRSAVAIVEDRDAFAAAARTRFSSARFRLYMRERLLADAFREDDAFSVGRRLWMLGDLPAVTMLLGRSWPYYFDTFYEASPVDWQRRLVRQLERKPPVLVGWDPENSSFDGVPNVARVPLIFDWAITHLVPKRQVGSFQVLQPRAAGEPVDLAWWRARLGSTLELGSIPMYTKVGRSPCTGGDECRSYAVVDIAKPFNGFQYVSVEVDGLSFRIGFRTRPNASRYVIDLRRVWFWHNAPEGAKRAVAEDLRVGAHVSVIRRMRTPAVLY